MPVSPLFVLSYMGNVHPVTGGKGLEGQENCSPTIILTSAPGGVGGKETWYSLYMRPYGLYGQSGRVQENLAPNRIRSPDLPARS
jgi:hypothetical protein